MSNRPVPNPLLIPRLCRAALCCVAVLLSACTTAPETPANARDEAAISQAWAGQAEPWKPFLLPGKDPSLYRYVRLDGRDAVSAQSDKSASMLRRNLRVESTALGQLRFSWKVPTLIPDADVAVREHEDSPVRIVLAFDGDRDRFSGKNRALSELSRLLTGEEMPYATLMYVWCNKRAPGTVVVNPRSDRIRSIVVESGPTHLNQWRSYERDLRADFQKAFGEAPGALVDIGLMTDSDNTQSTAQAWYGPISLLASDATPPDALR